MFVRYCVLSALLIVLGGAAVPNWAATKVQSSGLEYQIDKTPGWVEKIQSPTALVATLQNAGSVQILLSDTQINLLGQKPTTYYHGKNVAQERSGLESVSTIRIQFNPRFETLTLHDLAVFREGKRIDRLKSARIDLAQRERRLEDGVYDEDVEAIVALTDVRIGDVVEFGYSITGENPIFAGRHSSFFVLNRDQPIARLTVRIQYPENRKFYHRLYRSEAPVIETVERGIKKLRLDAEGLPPVRTEPAVPMWFGMYPNLQVTEYGKWEDVGVWAKGLYDIPTELSTEIEAVLGQIKAQAKNSEELVAATLAWVQNEIRYYSIAVGSSSHRPNHPNVTVRQRFGDCKDKSLLLSAMLRRLGIQAEPALVSNQVRKRVADILPTPNAFDHVIVRVQLGSHTYWLDGTRTYQGRRLANLGSTQFGKALVINASPVRDLVDVITPSGARSGMEITETFKVVKYGEPTTLLFQGKYYGSFAEWFRGQIAANGIHRAMEPIRSDYARDFPNIAPSGEAKVADDPIGNSVTIDQEFSIPQLFSYESGRAKMPAIYARSMVPWLRFPGASDRKFPLALPFPETFDHIIIVETPNKMPAPGPTPESWQDRHYALSNRITIDDNRVTFRYSAKVLQDHVAPADFPSFSEKLKQASGMLFSSLSVPVVDGAQLRSRLTRDFERADINFRKPDQLDSYHQNFVRSYAIADESINSRLLAGVVLAKAYKDRAEAASSLGRRQEALADVTKALEIDPNDAAFVLKAEIQLYSGLYRETLATLENVRQEANNANALIAAGMAHFFLGNFEQAQRTFSKAAEVADPQELPYALIWLALAERKVGHGPTEAIKKHSSRLATGWPAEAVNFMLGESSADNLVAVAKQDEKESRLRLCEAYFYLGEKALLEGNSTDAKYWFGKSVDTKAIMYREHIFAQQELKRITQQ